MVDYSFDGFMTHTSRRFGKFSKWKEKGSTVGFIHPGLWIKGRRSHSIIPAVVTKDGQEEAANKRYNCVVQKQREDEQIAPEQEMACPLCALVKFAQKKVADGTDPSEVVLHSGSSEKVSYTFAAAACQMSGKQWRDNLGYARDEYVFAWIPAKEINRKEGPVEVMTEGEGVKTAIKRVFNSRVEDWGDEKGNPRKHPFALKLIHNKNEIPARKYDAQPVDAQLAPITPEIEDIMQAGAQDLGVDLDSMCEPGHAGDIMAALRSSWNSRSVPFEEFEQFYGTPAPANQPGDGQEQESWEPEGKPEGGFCSACGKSAGGGKFCRECGEPLGKGQASQPEERPKEQPAGDGLVKCCNPKCGKMMTPMKFGKRCPECGTQQDVLF